jgi:hypothetical protein
MSADPEQGASWISRADGGDRGGKSFSPAVFAFRGTEAGVEFRRKHCKYVSVLAEDNLPDYGEEGQEAMDAYLEFLRGLDLINQQEFIRNGRKNADLKYVLFQC